jgi:fatty-acyl-CoA synthase
MTVPAGRLAALSERRAALEARHPVWVPRTLHAALDAAAARWPDRPYVITDEAVCSYAEVRDRSLRLARALVAAGVRPGEHVALEMANYPEFVVGKFAISRTGAAAIPVNFLNRRDELAYVLRQSRAVMLITMARFRDLDYIAMLDDIAPGWQAGGGGAALRGGGGAALADLRRVVVFDNDGAGVPAGASTLAELEAGELPLIELPVVELPVVDPGAIADILYTSVARPAVPRACSSRTTCCCARPTAPPTAAASRTGGGSRSRCRCTTCSAISRGCCPRCLWAGRSSRT